MEEMRKLFWFKVGIYGPLLVSIAILIFGVQIHLITLIQLPGVIDHKSIWRISEIFSLIFIFILISLSGYFYLLLRKKINKIVNSEGEKDED
ncbi:MAG: hypothetical protein KJI71_01680 [Patescibacteria group bacterium]|nr:hypothetical protein [Patescibacteria group bacterium]